jgi:eukaryotic-like serine/threonine-protein kinase
VSVYSFSPGMTIYKYRLVSELGSGQSDVWLAEDTTTSKRVALKLLDAVQAPVAARLYEAQTGARFSHPNLCEVLYADVVQVSIPRSYFKTLLMVMSMSAKVKKPR